jgi:hypothetical protein
MLPIEANEPTLPIDSTDPRDQTDSTESCDHSDHHDDLRMPISLPDGGAAPLQCPAAGSLVRR